MLLLPPSGDDVEAAPSWASIAGANWGFFGLLARFGRAFHTIHKEAGTPVAAFDRLRVLHLLGVMYHEANGAHVVDAEAAEIARLGQGGSMLWSSIAARVSRSERVARNFATGAAAVPLPEDPSRGLALFLIWESHVGLLDGLDALSLPGVLLLQMPRALEPAGSSSAERQQDALDAAINQRREGGRGQRHPGSAPPLAEPVQGEVSPAGPLSTMASAGRWRSSACGRFPHCMALHGINSLRGHTAALSARSAQGSEELRCGVAVRTVARRTLLGDRLRAHCRLQCETPVVEVLWSHAQRVLDAEPGSQVFHFVDVGAHHGDCFLAAVALMPEGSLRGLAVEPDAEAVQVLRENMILNKIADWEHAGGSGNMSWVGVRPVVALDRLVDGQRLGVLQGTGGGTLVDTAWRCEQASKATEHGSYQGQVQASTLDAELPAFLARSGSPTVDVLSIFVNGAELTTLRGAEDLLREDPGGSAACWCSSPPPAPGRTNGRCVPPEGRLPSGAPQGRALAPRRAAAAGGRRRRR
ncbi:unnamed protein product [Prorocentrum cordatum]|uniref:Methyltransferase FkbM domain-containing protein n=1 Tax=Prorocentrum cordatum TaxID=2364126 RepID=A0ABN9VNA5_9DINO|nr:unnamed protein product [Polarella glacialis]